MPSPVLELPPCLPLDSVLLSPEDEETFCTLLCPRLSSVTCVHLLSLDSNCQDSHEDPCLPSRRADEFGSSLPWNHLQGTEYLVTEFTLGRWPQDLMWSTVLLPHIPVTNTENQDADSPYFFSSGAFQDPVASYMRRYQLTVV